MIAQTYPDIPRIYTAIAEWAACMVYIVSAAQENRVRNGAADVFDRNGWRRIAGICILMLIIQCAFLTATKDVPTALWLPCMQGAVLIMLVFIKLVCRISFLGAAYNCVRAFLLAEFAASLEWQLHCFLFIRTENQSAIGRILLLLIVYGAVFAAAWYLERPLMTGEGAASISWRELCSAVVITLAAFTFSNLSFIYQNSPFSGRLASDIFNIRTLVDLGGIAILYAFQSRISELNAERELAAIDAALKSQYDQYRSVQESMELIHIQYHDLKHQIAGLRAETDANRRKEWLDTMERELDQNRLISQTGNQVLDTILAGKFINCRRQMIKLTCVADGKLLEFIHVTDLCTIFGNALDNAIESVTMESDPDKRLIHVSVSAQKGFLIIQMENYCGQEVIIENGLPRTTKSDKKNHGFGLKSIRNSAKKYGGTISIAVNRGWFELKIIIPMPEDRK